MNVILYGIMYAAIPTIILLNRAMPQQTQPAAPTTAEAVAEQPEDPLSTQPVEEPAPEPACDTQKSCNEQIVHVFTVATWGEQEWAAMKQIVLKESGFKNTAQNRKSTAYGLFQFLDSTWKGTGHQKTDDPIQQTEAGVEYIKRRYGTPTNALNFHKRNGWY